MSLLMQALQKAAKEREQTIRTPAPTGMLASELALEPIGADAAVAQSATGSRSTESAPAGAPTPAQAATILQASDPRPNWLARLREQRKKVYGALLVLAVVGYALYFYLSVFHPALLRQPLRSPAAAVAPPPRVAPAVAPPRPVEPAETGAVAAAPAPVAPAGETPLPTTPSPRKAITRQPDPPVPAAPRAAARRPVAATEAPAKQPGSAIAVKPGGEAPRVNPQLAEAYGALRAGRLDEASRLYEAVLKADPRNVDALLGRAAVAQQQGNADLATRYLFQVLQIDPSNTFAQGVLVNLLGSADPQSAELKLKSLIAKEPTAFLYFSLGNLYADQGNWPAAQAAYFQAHHLARTNPDYAFNLAVSLEHLSQPKLALNFYQQALELALAAGRANFDPAAVRERISRLAAGAQ